MDRNQINVAINQGDEQIILLHAIRTFLTVNYTCTYIHTHTHTNRYTHTYTQTYTNRHTPKHTQTHTHTHTHTLSTWSWPGTFYPAFWHLIYQKYREWPGKIFTLFFEEISRFKMFVNLERYQTQNSTASLNSLIKTNKTKDKIWNKINDIKIPFGETLNQPKLTNSWSKILVLAKYKRIVKPNIHIYVGAF